MTAEEMIIQELQQNFGLANDAAQSCRRKRISATVNKEHFDKILGFCVSKLDFSSLCTISGLDEGESLSFVYHLSRKDGIVLSLKFSVPKADPQIETVTGYFPSADIYERELVDLLGAKVIGLPPGNRYPLPDDWPQNEYPLRKDWKRKDSQNEG